MRHEKEKPELRCGGHEGEEILGRHRQDSPGCERLNSGLTSEKNRLNNRLISVRVEVKKKLDDYRNNLRREMGLPEENTVQFKLPQDRPFTKEERKDVTLLFGGLTPIHDVLLQGALEGLGYRSQHIPTPDNKSLSLGKEFCNRGQCNPTYYTVGNLIKALKKMREEGIEDIERKYAYITVGACGPCRFGMYEAEYRKALKDAGFEGLRVLTISQSIDQDYGDAEAGLKRDATFYITLVKAVMLGDMVNELKYRIRPYEVIPGSTEKAVTEALKILYDALKERSNHFVALRKANKIVERVPVDYSRVKPKVKVIASSGHRRRKATATTGSPCGLRRRGARSWCSLSVDGLTIPSGSGRNISENV